MNDKIRYKGIFRVWDSPYTSEDATEYLQWYVAKGGRFEDIPGVKPDEEMTNTVMQAFKLDMINASFGLADRLIITNQTTTPQDNETSYPGVFYTSTVGDLIYKSNNTNPFRMGFNIRSSAANGTWGSFILVTADGRMINRALANTSKKSGVAKIIDFEGRLL